MRLWIDDLRTSPEGWAWAKTSAEAQALLAENNVTEVSFDHDLGGDDTTWPVLLWLSEHDCWPPVVHVHSANPPGAERIRGMAERYGPGVTR